MSRLSFVNYLSNELQLTVIRVAFNRYFVSV